MKIKKFVTLLLVFLSTCSFASQFNGTSIQKSLAKQQESLPFEFTSPVMYLIPFHKDNQLVTFYVDSVTKSGKESDPLTVVCNNVEFKINAGATGTCQVLQAIPSYFGVDKKDFKNGSSGTLTLS
jgi:hypothetical protein